MILIAGKRLMLGIWCVVLPLHMLYYKMISEIEV